MAGARQIDFDWGEPYEFGSTAFWVAESKACPPTGTTALTSSLLEETVCCMLGGFGMPAEVGLAAFDAVREAGMLAAEPSPQEVEDLLAKPLVVRAGQATVRYRYPRQRSRWVCDALGQFRSDEPPADAPQLRQWLLQITGVGPKTASWIVRNHLSSDDVAIIDVHIERAGRAAGFFHNGWTPGRHYAEMEEAFLQVCDIAQIGAAQLDATIWGVLHDNPSLRKLLARPNC